MATTVGNPPRPDLGRLRAQMEALAREMGGDTAQVRGEGGSFAELLKSGIKEVNQSLVEAEKVSMDLASGKNTNLHQAMIAMSQAEIAFDFLVQLRNKGLEAYQEILKMQV